MTDNSSSHDEAPMLTCNVTEGDWLTVENGDDRYFGEVTNSGLDRVTVQWEDGKTEHILRDMLDDPAYSRVDDIDAPNPKGFAELLNKVHDLEL